MAAVCAVLTQILSLSRSCNFFSRFLQASFLDENLAMKNECFVYLCVFHKKKLYMYCIILSGVREMKKDIWIVESVKQKYHILLTLERSRWFPRICASIVHSMAQTNSPNFKNVHTIWQTARPNIRAGAHQSIRSSKLASARVASVSHFNSN